MAEQTFDLVVIGSGPGGYVAAIRAAQLGMKTAIVEREQLGGICLNWGCIPTKALLRSSEVLSLIRHAEEYGLSVTGASFDVKKIVERSRKVSARLSGGVGFLMKKHKITVIEGTARLKAPGLVGITTKAGQPGDDIRAKHIIIATGARARALPGINPDGRIVWTYREAMVPAELPKSLLVVGSGAIGIEFASFYRTLGAEVTVVEIMDRILPVEDAEISELARRALSRQGMRIHVSTSLDRLEVGEASAKARLKKGDGASEEITVERVILAVGITGNVENLGLEALGVKVDRGHIVVDPWSRTNVPGIYAIGDVAGPPWLAHKASHEGVVCVEKIAGVPGLHPLDVSKIPGCTYCQPQVASVGLTEAAAKAKGLAVKVGRFPFTGNGKAIALGEPQGLVKTVFDARTGELVGAHMIGAEVTELIQGYTIARTMEGTEEDLMHTVFPHPTLSEMMHEAVLDAYGRVIHV